MNARGVILLLSVALLASIGGALAYRFVFTPFALPDQPSASGTTTMANRDIVGSHRPDYTLGSSLGEQISASNFDGRLVLLNFWATWCKPCREEMPMLLELQRTYRDQDFQVVGIALDDVQQARDFAVELGIDYPILVGSTDVMTVARLYGNLSGVLPYSVLIDRQGVIRWAHLGELKEPELNRRITEWLQ